MTPARGSNGMHQGPVPDESGSLAALKDALDKLAPSEIATVKSLLDSKMGPPGWNGAPGCNNSQWSGGTPQFPVRQMSNKWANANAGRQTQVPTRQYNDALNVAAPRRCADLDSEG